MKRVFVIAILTAVCLQMAAGTGKDKKQDKQDKILYALSTVANGDTIPSFELMDVNIYSRMNSGSKRKQRKYDKLVRDVVKVYPYSKEIKAVLIETYLYLQTIPDEDAQKKYLDKVEKGVWDQYLPVMKKLTLSQGKLLIKLIDRECNQTSFELINAFIGKFKANFYQVFASLFGATLKKEYDPAGADSEIEDIIYMIENNLLEIP